ncbi:MAG: RNA-binding S4 domain-containing protein [Flavobacteriales bacterium]|nr:RNA-binding S4 domain-containing protein [Flavobacteriales bacterium]
MPSASIDFELRGEFIELNQLLKLAGLCNSGGEGKMLVAQGLVKVDGAVELRKTCKVRAGQVVSYRDAVVKVSAIQL